MATNQESCESTVKQSIHMNDRMPNRFGDIACLRREGFDADWSAIGACCIERSKSPDLRLNLHATLIFSSKNRRGYGTREGRRGHAGFCNRINIRAGGLRTEEANRNPQSRCNCLQAPTIWRVAPDGSRHHGVRCNWISTQCATSKALVGRECPVKHGHSDSRECW